MFYIYGLKLGKKNSAMMACKYFVTVLSLSCNGFFASVFLVYFAKHCSVIVDLTSNMVNLVNINCAYLSSVVNTAVPSLFLNEYTLYL